MVDEKFLKISDTEVYMILPSNGELNCEKVGCIAGTNQELCERLNKHCNHKDIVFVPLILNKDRF